MTRTQRAMYTRAERLNNQPQRLITAYLMFADVLLLLLAIHRAGFSLWHLLTGVLSLFMLLPVAVVAGLALINGEVRQ